MSGDAKSSRNCSRPSTPPGHNLSRAVGHSVRKRGRSRSRATLQRYKKIRRMSHVRSDRWPKWACRRAPAKHGALLERWRAQCGFTRSTIHDPTTRIRRCAGGRGVYSMPSRFPEPCGHFGLQPSPKHCLGRPVKDFTSRTNPGDTFAPPVPRTVPASCPTCRSSSIVTTSKIPDAESYWRCTNCGEVWNDSRRQTPQYGARGWR